MLSDVVEYLACPVCGTGLDIAHGSVRCLREHSFDIARQGYVNLLPGDASPGTADTAAMVEARADFLAEGHFGSLAALLAGHVATRCDETACVLDAGAGTGYYLAATLDRMPGAVGAAFDISKYASRRAARAHPRIGAVVGDLWRALPARTGVVGGVLSVFAPRNATEFHRVLRPDGALFVITPTSRHLCELVPALGLLSVDDDKIHNLDTAFARHFTLATREDHESGLLLGHAAAESLALMGPSAWHRTAADVRRRLAGLPAPIAVTASFTLSVYRPDG
jgi:23S rRNA (guanine745-N1)-methyltransferase